MKKNSQQKAINSKLLLGIALLVLGSVLIFGGPDKLSIPGDSYTFASEPVEITGFDLTESSGGSTPLRLLIPDLSIDLEVGKSEIIAGYWEVFTDKAGWGVGSGLPGEDGNQVIFAHAREGLFLSLKGITADMPIYVLTQDGWYSYEISEIKEVYPNQTEVIAPTQDETLTLYTCVGFEDSKRLIVVGKRTSITPSL